MNRTQPNTTTKCGRRAHPTSFRWGVFGVFVSGLLLAPTALAAEEAEPDPAAILDGYVMATGGASAYEKIHSRVTKGRLEQVGMGFEDPTIAYAAAPDRQYVLIDSDAFGKVEYGTDGSVVWYLSESTGPIVEDGVARTAGLREAAFDADLNWRKYFPNVEYAGEEILDGKPCHKIVLTPEVGEPETRYFDKESNLLVFVKKTRLSSKLASQSMDLSLSDYKWVDGLFLPHRIRRSLSACSGGQREMLMVVDSIQHNVDMPADRFTPPLGVRAEAIASGTAELFRQVVSGGGPAQEKPASPPCGTAGTAESKEGSDESVAERKPCGGGS